MPTSQKLGVNFLDDLNPIQQQAVKATEGPCLILAGAGSGKTKVLTHRVTYLIAEKKIPPENILSITFTNKAANEMKSRIQKLLDQQTLTTSPAKGPLRLSEASEARQRRHQPVMGTFHSFCARILRKDGHFLGIPPSFSIYDENDALDAVKEAMKNLNLTPQKTSPAAVRTVISQAKNEMISSLEYPQYARGYFQETVAKVYLEYQKILDKNRAADFDDLLLLTVKLFQNYPEVLTKHQIQFRYILIDEYQDTNPAQYLLSKLLAGRHKNICVVGDASQSIYSFRSADFRNIINFKNDYPSAQVFNLEQNYRSTQTILDAAYSVISKNQTHPILKLWTNNPTGEKVRIVETRNEVEEALFVVQTIQQLVATTNHQPLTLNHFAVLYRTNAQSRALEEVFLKAGLPYILVGGIRFYERKEVKDILAYLRLLVNPNDTISKARIEKIGKGRTAKFFSLIEEIIQNLVNFTTLELLNLILARTAYLEYLDDGSEVGKSKIENVKELRSVAEQFPDLIEFLENVALVESEYSADEKAKKSSFAKASEDKKDAVTLTTLHQAKGLEWPVVFMVGMEEGLFPHSRCLLDPNEMEEERRLCYVGMTRAKTNLFLTFVRQRLLFGTRGNTIISRFIIDLPKTLTKGQISATNQFLDDVTIDKGTDNWLDL